MDFEVYELLSQAKRLDTEFWQGGGISCVEEGIDLARKALGLCSPGHTERCYPLTWLSMHLNHRYSQLGATEDLEEAIIFTREALGLCPKGHPNRSMSLNNLASLLSTRYDLLGSVQDLDEAIVLDQEALDLRPKGHPDRSTSLNNLAIRLSIRYNLFGSMLDLEQAIVLDREALDLRPEGHPDRSTSLDNLAIHLSTQYNLLGSMLDLEQAIVLGREALDLRPKGHPNRSMSLNTLANRLSTRYGLLGSTQDLEQAIVLSKEALDLCSIGHPDRSMSLNNFAVRLSARYHLLGSILDLEQAIALDQEALDLRPKGHPDRPMSLNNLAVDLSTRYNVLGSMLDLEQAISLDREALELCPKGHPDRSRSLNNLGIRLSTRYRLLGSMEDLDEAIILGLESLDLRPKAHPGRSAALDNVAYHLCFRFETSKQLKDKEKLFGLYAELADVTRFVFSIDIDVARRWTEAAEYFQHPTLLVSYETSLRLLVSHVATLPSLPQHLSTFKKLTSSLAVDAFSACLRSRSLMRAIELLEQGRGVFWSQLNHLRSPVEDVAASDAGGRMLADEFLRLTSLIQTAMKSSSADEHASERVWRLNLEMQTVVNKIRELPGHSRFLLPSLFSDLRRAAKGGPVIVVNASKYSCDALIILLDREPVHVPFHITQQGVQELAAELFKLTGLAKRRDVAKPLAFFLRRLWEHVVSPIVDLLQTICSTGSRIWWCPTAEFSQLPLHAAGPYRSGHKNLSHLYISSYTPTLTALIRAQQSTSLNSATTRKRFTAVGQGNAVGQRKLPSVNAELEMINRRVSSLATFTRIDGEESCIARVVEELNQSEWIHLSCHGLPEPTEPFQSAFALHDGHFTIQQIIACDLKHSEFAYLSACHTTVGYEESADEVIHLAAAMQFAGFRSVIGTMWAVDDGETNKIASTFYKHMVDDSGRLDHTRAAYALNRTMKSVDIPFDQKILYIHLGV